MEKINLGAGRPFEDQPVPWLSPKVFDRRCTDGVVIDTRDVEAYAGGHIPGSYSVWLAGMARYGGWVTEDAAPVYLIVESPGALREARLALARIGRDNVAGALRGGFANWRDAGLAIETAGTLSAQRLAHRSDEFVVLDVREPGEFEEEGHIPGARHVHVGELESRLHNLELSKDVRIVATCSVGHRGSLGASILKRNGFTNAFNLLGGMTAWKKLKLPLEGAER
jgi:hydroxyacylglutathione hydrolase